MIARRRSAALRAALATAALLALTWLAGGQARLGRIDPALVLPWLPLALAPLAALDRRASAQARSPRSPVAGDAHYGRAPALADTRGVLIVIVPLLIGQAILAFALAGQIPWAQLALAGAGAALAAWLAARLAQGRREGATRVAAALLLAGSWFAGSHMLLAALYRAPPAAGPPVTMLAGLPLRWSAGGDMAAMIAQGTNDDPALQRIEASGPLRLVDSLVDHPPAPGGALLLAHPRALAPRELVAIDAFVRGGGRAVILADALSGWPARHPLGDPRNPPVTSLLTPLLDHWGVTLAAAPPGERTASAVDVDGARLRLFSAGRFERLPATCAAYADRRIARCRIGRGEAWLVGDADLLFAPLWQPTPRWAAHLRQADTMEWLAARLRPGAPRAMLRPVWIRAAQ